VGGGREEGAQPSHTAAAAGKAKMADSQHFSASVRYFFVIFPFLKVPYVNKCGVKRRVLYIFPIGSLFSLLTTVIQVIFNI
jgi:hypothetical protein